jgi:hypothetical protein
LTPSPSPSPAESDPKPDPEHQAHSPSTSPPDHRTYAEWYVWARRNLSSSDEVCHATANAAVAAVAAGGDAQLAARQAARHRHGPGWVQPAPAFYRAYAEWFDWARKHLGSDAAGHHRAASAALQALEAGGDTHVGAEAAMQAAHAPLNDPRDQAEKDAPLPQEHH